MVPHFIEVHDCDFENTDSERIMLTLCLDNVVGFNRYVNDPEKAIIAMTDGSWHVTAESYTDVKALIQKAGCQITKADPRLDTAHPIPWDDLVKLEMLGQPVFNSNSRKWMLVLDSAGPYTHDWIVLLNDAGAQEKWTKHDVQARPLYRMRKED